MQDKRSKPSSSDPVDDANGPKSYQYLMDLTRKLQAEEIKLCMWKNTDDGYRWEGYGSRKMQDGTPNRKAYYRCVNVRAPNGCQAKKVLQEHPDDPRVVMVTYKGHHCHEPVRHATALHPILKHLHSPSPFMEMAPEESLTRSRSLTAASVLTSDPRSLLARNSSVLKYTREDTANDFSSLSTSSLFPSKDRMLSLGGEAIGSGPSLPAPSVFVDPRSQSAPSVFVDPRSQSAPNPFSQREHELNQERNHAVRNNLFSSVNSKLQESNPTSSRPQTQGSSSSSRDVLALRDARSNSEGPRSLFPPGPLGSMGAPGIASLMDDNILLRGDSGDTPAPLPLHPLPPPPPPPASSSSSSPHHLPLPSPFPPLMAHRFASDPLSSVLPSHRHMGSASSTAHSAFDMLVHVAHRKRNASPPAEGSSKKRASGSTPSSSPPLPRQSSTNNTPIHANLFHKHNTQNPYNMHALSQAPSRPSPLPKGLRDILCADDHNQSHPNSTNDDCDSSSDCEDDDGPAPAQNTQSSTNPAYNKSKQNTNPSANGNNNNNNTGEGGGGGGGNNNDNVRGLPSIDALFPITTNMHPGAPPPSTSSSGATA